MCALISDVIFRSVLFKGQIERKSSLVSKFFGTADRSVLVAINMNGLHIIRRTTPPVRKDFLCNCLCESFCLIVVYNLRCVCIKHIAMYMHAYICMHSPHMNIDAYTNIIHDTSTKTYCSYITYTHIHTSTVCLHTHIHVCAYMYIHTHIHMYLLMYNTHTHIHCHV